ncbi:hypothetical protein KC19_10G132100 [Ceratodon purpureus]|uniref:Secreted protein n=1 Tax=Ceratodon purpureus TaxID=3225 RepID=A0A8T0GLF3_CERPU|nr:hypothetical protein KC19_10G132100 [Ceratodon purpureus]
MRHTSHLRFRCGSGRSALRMCLGQILAWMSVIVQVGAISLSSTPGQTVWCETIVPNAVSCFQGRGLKEKQTLVHRTTRTR